MLHTTVIHELREKHQLTIHEYCVLEAVAFLSGNPKSPVAGWCCASKAYIAKALGVSKAFVVDAIGTLADRGLVEKSVDGRLVRTTSLYYDERQRHNEERERHKSNGKQSDRSKVIDTTDSGNASDRDRSSIRPPSKILSKNINEDISVASAPNKKTLEERRNDFKMAIAPFVSEFGRDMCNDFYAYWAEITRDGKKMNFELQRTWEVYKRLGRWKKNDDEKKAKQARAGKPFDPPATVASSPESYHLPKPRTP